MKRILCIFASLLTVALVEAQSTSYKVYDREFAASTGVLLSDKGKGGGMAMTYGANLTRWNDWNGGVRVGVNYSQIPYNESIYMSIPLHLTYKVDVPWFIGLDIFDDFFWTMAFEADTFEQTMFYVVAGAIVSVMPKSIELCGGISPGYVVSNNDNNTYYSGDILTRPGFGCSLDLGVKATARFGRVGFFIAPLFSWQLMPSLYYDDSHYDEHRFFGLYTCGLSFAF